MGTAKELAKGIAVGLVVNGILFLLSFGLNYLGFNSAIDLLNMQLPFWITLVVILMSVPIAAMYVESKRNRGSVHVGSIPSRPNPALTYEMENFGVKWKVLYGPFPHTFRQPYAFTTNPYCPNCDYEMETEKRGLLKKYYWKCHRCGKLYKCPAKHAFDADRIVERLLESEIRSGRVKLGS